MTEPAYVAVDWGTSSFRLWLVDRAGQVLAERRSDEGMLAAAKTGFPAVLQSHLAAVEAPDHLPVLVCGMAGAKTGWVEAGYVDTPAPLSAVLNQAVRVPGQARDIRILPGIAQRDAAAPDVMRGEETQLLGALGLDAVGEALVCMPGTHSKWVRVRGGIVERFSTFMTGELFGVIARETILSLAIAGADEAEDVASLKAAVKAAYAAPAFAANLLFTARSRQLLFGGTPAAARETLSGTLIGAELAAGLSGAVPQAGVALIASGRLAMLYRQAFDALSVAVQPVDADEAVRRGLSMAAAAIWTK
ncbi:2-dehydro-3-deoxygalactonokinase [Bradyrhizobium sp. WBOS7]|uniref:2-dehydro-3-deoxygalactonokinase n=1 Tax=Bradyrhizobium betae TaxID=244734 RepID=A0AAE9SN23_9BRAD|nr:MULTISPECIES: 2-dehydro-3-deoxygalactonokinase [Bradyrhizobium]MDD1574984.1 2-dehydro-3-deoxygalactonokinase [Bradyrhizobium sp. WBOS1]UUO33375.1 2-dehydro-3-deoxygalactonokinase [Bradyrhizobium sp. WBOS01]MDD1531686.1 2-dehydro-3-deoxygalactonokinase [Bradyrhizobium sp. WBOS2]MDD1580934.1 2-dehydro-3-deoxygalactonokinase [Bradyrhizobium sp. WBOS7]MDD1604878.1 2-dehydro-3-deoxygalactonokinase [Bradyrhizobium sp. WBOS16]